VVDPALVRELVTAGRRRDPLAMLSSREHEVLALMAEGRSNAGIARALWITEGPSRSTSGAFLPSWTSPGPRMIIAAF
jgi:FixJ family two-component response regulator